MASQLNPAWQRRPLSSNHLAKISAGFLSDGPSTGQTSDGRQVIPFLLDNSGQEWIVRDLCEVLRQRGQNSGWQTLGQDAAADKLPAALCAGESDANNGFSLLASTVPAIIEAYRFDHLVLLVPASLDGVRNAYVRIKRLAGEHIPDMGVVMVGPRDQHAAWRYFRKLAVGSLRFLDIPLLNLGFLPQQVASAEGPSDHHRQNFLTRISERLLRSGFHSCYPAGITSGGTR
jgi:hypothetical protein